MNQKIRRFGAGVLVALWAVLTGFAWFSPVKELSDAERRPLAQMPQFTGQSMLNGTFVKDFEKYTLDQFPLRDQFRQIKSLFHYYVLNQLDNNEIYIAEGHAAELEYPLNEASVNRALGQLQRVYEKYLKNSGSKIYTAVVPDKGYYIAEENGYLSMDYKRLFDMVRQGMPWAQHIDLTALLSAEDYYFTDTHWRQERLLKVAQRLSEQMGITPPQTEDFTVTELERPFYGVYYGQAALPMQPDTLCILENPLLKDCRVYNYVTEKYTQIYDMKKAEGKDLYEVYLSGAQSLLRIENPSASTDRELIVFRDSFGSSLTPLLVDDYKTVTLVDIRYINVELLGNYIDFHGQDVLFLYSTLVLNKNLI